MKKLALVLTLALVLAFAMPVFANPFSDVPADHWAYDAISKLAADGVITGNPDGTYTGKRNLTRYEIAVIVAKAMAAAEADADKVSAEQQATIDKLAAEFGKELSALGVKVAALEKKIGNVKFTGDARIRQRSDQTKKAGEDKKQDDYFQARFRLKAAATVNDKVTVVTRLVTGNVPGTDDNYNLTKENGNSNLIADQFYVQYADKKVTAIAGRQDLVLGQKLIIDDKIKGITVTAPVGENNKITIAHGRLDRGEVTATFGLPNTDNDKYDLTALQFDTKLMDSKLKAGIDLARIEHKGSAANAFTNFNRDSDKLNILGLNLDYAVNKKVNLFGEYTKTDAKDKNKAYTFGVGVKQLVGKTDVKFAYNKIEKYSVLPGLTSNSAYGKVASNDKTDMFVVRLDNALMPSTNLYVEYTDAQGKTNDKKDKFTRLETGIEFKF